MFESIFITTNRDALNEDARPRKPVASGPGVKCGRGWTGVKKPQGQGCVRSKDAGGDKTPKVGAKPDPNALGDLDRSIPDFVKSKYESGVSKKTIIGKQDLSAISASMILNKTLSAANANKLKKSFPGQDGIRLGDIEAKVQEIKSEQAQKSARRKKINAAQKSVKGKARENLTDAEHTKLIATKQIKDFKEENARLRKTIAEGVQAKKSGKYNDLGPNERSNKAFAISRARKKIKANNAALKKLEGKLLD